MSSQYLKRIDIAEVQDLAEVNTQFLKRVNVVEVLDQDGETFFPPDPDSD